MSVEIITRQTTYWDLRTSEGMLRVHFRNKKETSFAEGAATEFQILREHPVLLDYRHNWQETYVCGPAADSAGVLRELEAVLVNWTDGWRPAKRYLNSDSGPERILRSGSGLLLRAPVPVVRLCCDCLKTHSVPYRTDLAPESPLPSRHPSPCQALVVGRSYVVAEEFRVE